MRKRTIDDASWDNGGPSGYRGHHPQYAHDVSYRHQHHPAASFDGFVPAGHYYPPHHHGGHHPPPPPPPPVHPYGGVDYGHGPYQPPAPPGFHPGDMSYDPQQQYHYGGYYHHHASHHPHAHGHVTPDGSFHEGMVFDHSYHSHQDVSATTYAQTPGRPWHPHHHHHHHAAGSSSGHHPPPHGAGSPYWGHLNLSQLPGVAASPVVHQTPSRPPRGDGRQRNAGGRQRGGGGGGGNHGGQGGAGRDAPVPPAGGPGARSLNPLLFNYSDSPASRFAASAPSSANANPQQPGAPRDGTDAAPPPPPPPPAAGPSLPGGGSPPSPAALPASRTGDSFILPAIEAIESESPRPAREPAQSDLSMRLKPPEVKRQGAK